MASLLGEQLYEIKGQGPPPEKDYFQLRISKNEVIFISWRISLRRGSWGVGPKEDKVSHQDLQQDKRFQSKILAVFGQRILDYTIMICEGKFDYLERLPEDILLKISSYLGLKDLAQLAQVSQSFREFCNSEKLWEKRVRAVPEFTNDMEKVCSFIGWKQAFFDLFQKRDGNE
uniref:F-box protein 36a n=1 Tax=Neogobius melanostomus TaxID=47308 RepID=A0A8C6WT01_9GOBI